MVYVYYEVHGKQPGDDVPKLLARSPALTRPGLDHLSEDLVLKAVEAFMADMKKADFTDLTWACHEEPSLSRAQHQYRVISTHGEDAPNKSLDTYSYCGRCGTLKHDYHHNGGRTSPNYPMFCRIGYSGWCRPEPECVS